MRIATYNVEWMSNLFDDAGNLQMDDRWSGRRDVTRAQQLQALKRVFREVDADAVMIIEAPDGHKRRDGVAALRNFAAWAGLRAGEALMGFDNETQQENASMAASGSTSTSMTRPIPFAGQSPRWSWTA